MAYSLGGPPAPTFLGKLMSGLTLAAGSHFRQGYQLHYPYSCGIASSTATSGLPIQVTDEVEGCLYNTGAFTNVTATCSGGWITGSQYLLVEGDTAVDFAQPSDLTGLITDNLKNCVTTIGTDAAINNVDPLQIDAIPTTVAGNQNYQQTTTGPGSLQQIATTNQLQQQQNQNQPGAQCDWNTMSFGQYLGCQLGFSSGITAGVALGAVVIIALLARK
jgi:hypothetical protein